MIRGIPRMESLLVMVQMGPTVATLSGILLKPKKFLGMDQMFKEIKISALMM